MNNEGKALIRQVATFGVSGVIATLVHVAVGVSLNRFVGLSPFTANLIAFPIATCVTLFSNSRLTFKGHGGGAKSFGKGLATVLFGLALNQLIVVIVTDSLGYPYEIALIVIIATVPAVTFLLFKFWAFRA